MTDSTATLGRRGFLKGTAAGATAFATAGTAGVVGASTSSNPPTFGGWMDGANGYTEVVDARGQSSVTVEVGTEASNGPFGFGPAAVRVDPGTEVVWRWTGEGSHNVVAKDGGFESDLTDEKGFTFARTFEETGVQKYFCRPHKAMGMKGVVVVGDAMPDGGAGSARKSSSKTDYGGWFNGVSNFEGTVDATGQDEVTVEVGVEANGGSFGYGPAAVKVDPGTTVVWEWTGAGTHNVVAKDGSFESELTGEEGFTFERTFTASGVHEYYCTPHKPMGMKGAVVVAGSGSDNELGSRGSVGADALGGSSDGLETGELLFGGGVVGAMGALLGLGVLSDAVGEGSTWKW